MTAVTDTGFVHLHVHSAYSLLEGALPIATLAKLAAKDRMPALALTDTNNLFGALEFSDKMAASGIQPIAGIQLSVAFADRDAGRSTRPTRHPALVLLAASAEGFGNLMHLASLAHLGPATSEPPHVPLGAFRDRTAGLIALSGGPTGPLDLALAEGKPELAAARVKALSELFPGGLYVELQRHGLDVERSVEAGLLDLAYDAGLPLVAANEPVFAQSADFEAHDALMAIAEGRLVSDDGRRRLTPMHDFKSRAEMVALFADLPEACAQSVEIARRCAFRVTKRKAILPRFTREEADAADGVDAEVVELRRQAGDGLEARLAQHGPARGLTREDYRERLAFELDVIVRMRYPGYFLIVADFIKWAKAQGIPVGPGRGSGAGSLVAYSLTITDLDPLRFGLLFERFLNPDRVSMPDFDIDFCQDRRDEVIRYVQGRYGHDRVAQIITFGTLLARGVMRDVGRVLEMPYGQVDRLTKLVPQNPANPITLAKAIETEPRLAAAGAEEPVVGRMLAIAQKLEGLYRHASTHAAGIVIGDRPLQELVPLYRDPKSDMPVTQYNMKWVEQAGLVKFDFLGLKTLTVLSTAADLIRKRGLAIDLSRVPLDDARTFEHLGRGETVGIFQVESAGMRKALVEMRADRFEDLIALVALYRPGPMANIPVYCARKQGRERIEYLHPKLEPILNETFGVITYQEQVQQIAKDLAGYTLGEADLLRRAMGKKIKAEMDAQRGRFLSGATGRGIAPAVAEMIFDACAKFAEYGFNKSHSAPYAFITYQTAYLKANFPVEFLAASMTLDMGNTDKLSEFRIEAGRLGIKVVPPSVNRSGVVFDVGDGAIVYALAAIKGVGRPAVESIVAARAEGLFRDLADFGRRLNPRLVNRRSLEALIAAGALDELEPDRARAHAAIDAVMALAQRSHENRIGGQSELFGGGGEREPLRIPEHTRWTSSERLQKEFAAVGFFLSGHPLDDYMPLLKRRNVISWAEFARSIRQGGSFGRVAVTVLDRAERRTRTGGKMGIVQCSDPSGQFEAILFSEALNQFRDLLDPGQAVMLTLNGAMEGEDVRARIQNVEPLEGLSDRGAGSLKIFLRDAAHLPGVAEQLRGAGEGKVSLVAMLEGGAGEIEVQLPGLYRTSPQVAGALRILPGVVAVELV